MVWSCAGCRERIEERFDACWSCRTSRDGVVDPDFEATWAPPSKLVTRRLPMDCLRCGRELDAVGTRNFHEGIRWGVFGDLGELFVNKESFNVYACSHCGHVEFFVSGVGESPGEESESG